MKKICILGTSPTSKNLAPFDEDDVEFWVLAQDNPKRADLVFEIHDFTEDYTEVMAKQNLDKFHCPKITMNKIEGIDSQAYPLNRVQKLLKEYGVNEEYITSSIGYMLLMAILEPTVREVYIYGVDMSGEGEYALQRPNCEFLIGILLGRGVKVIVPKESSLYSSVHRYGKKEHIVGGHSLVTSLILKRIKHNLNVLDDVINQINQTQGAIALIRNITASDNLEEIEETLTHELKKLLIERIKLEGIIKEGGAISEITKTKT